MPDMHAWCGLLSEHNDHGHESTMQTMLVQNMFMCSSHAQAARPHSAGQWTLHKSSGTKLPVRHPSGGNVH